MAVDVTITREILKEELARVREYGKTYKWGVIPDLQNLKVLVTMYSHTDDLFIIEITVDDYKEKPPFFEFVDPVTGERGTPRAYPKGQDTFFHQSGPCICAPFSRNAYKNVVATGPHQDWTLGDWMQSRANNFDWSNVTTLADMLSMIQNRLVRPELYEGRMGN
jgi:hypothetical protein